MTGIHERGTAVICGHPAESTRSQDWWASLTADELQHFVKIGFAAGALFDEAVAETKRRSIEASFLQSEAGLTAARGRRKRQRLSLLIWSAVAAALISAAVLLIILP